MVDRAWRITREAFAALLRHRVRNAIVGAVLVIIGLVLLMVSGDCGEARKQMIEWLTGLLPVMIVGVPFFIWHLGRASATVNGALDHLAGLYAQGGTLSCESFDSDSGFRAWRRAVRKWRNQTHAECKRLSSTEAVLFDDVHGVVGEHTRARGKKHNQLLLELDRRLGNLRSILERHAKPPANR